ncbi:helicase POLQ-like isoform X3 [Dunckerocampus dactyliophorus]|uniref:helicase POLQ-like isoform X3 n=1 Tax=Dunckerocampus dactyliophorus TaxID=161453 RepID=UPI0024071F69|nr:helicase POLQ-like isoform X3 [Dunckerocampus dactyliophorus]
MDHKQHVEHCSDSEDFFGDYDSLLEDPSLLAKLEKVECAESDKMASVPPAKDKDLFTDSILDGLDEDLLQESLPSSQQEFVQQEAKRSKVHGGDASGVFQSGGREDQKRRSVSERLKRTMRCNAAAPASLSRSLALKEAVLSDEISDAVHAMEVVSAHTTDLGPFFGLPTKVKDLLSKLRGINSLYAWQETCLTLECVQQRRNLIYTLPTSGGKTLVAELLILREVVCRKKDCMFILPYVSLVQEKVRGLAAFGLELDFLVEEYAGSKGKFPPVKRRGGQRSLYIATIEKAHSLVNGLIESGRLDCVGLLVVDELHMLGDGSRGALLEITLAKVSYLSRHTQIIGMSATLGNISELQTFLNAENYNDDFRPVQLREYVKVGDGIYEVDPKEDDGFRLCRRVAVKYSSAMQKADPDHIVALVTEVIPRHSCLLFCPTKKNCENVAVMICKYLREDFLRQRQAEKEALLRELKDSGNGSVCTVLRRTVPYGVAYHHSGLTGEERKLLEDAYSDGVLCLLTCTSTLAAGINLPARRVILRSPHVAGDLMKTSQYKQMAGRAGRAGLDREGESILIVQDKERFKARALVCAPVEKCHSCLLADDRKSLLNLILSLVGLKVSTGVEELQEFLRGTLLFVQQEQLCGQASLDAVLQQGVQLLQVKGLLHTQGDVLHVTRLGRATFKGSVDLSHSQVLYQDLSNGLEGLLLSSYLHLVFLVTPYDMTLQCVPDWMTFYAQMASLSAAEQRMCALVGVPESLVARKAAGQAVKKSANMAAVKRMYLALVLMALLRENDLWGVAHKFQLSRGFVQSLLSSAAAFCSCVFHFTQSRAKQLHAAGYKTLTHLANADPALLVRTIVHLNRKQANQMVASAKMLLNKKAAALQQEVDELLTPPADLPPPPRLDER